MNKNQIRKAIPFIKKAIQISESEKELKLCLDAVMKLEEELQKETFKPKKTKTSGYFKTYENTSANKNLKRLVR